MPFVPHTPQDVEEMLEAVNLQSVDDLFEDIPRQFRFENLDLPDGKSEMEVFEYIKRLSNQNATQLTSFLGAGFYDHYIPAAIDPIVTRGEYLTAYTPYQPEVSQGTLQSIYEYQSMICRLTGMEVSNASLYDGGTALYEAIMMSMRVTKRSKILMCSGVNPIYRKMIETYTTNLNIELIETPIKHGQLERDVIGEQLDKSIAAVIMQNPTFFGSVDDYSDVCNMAHEVGALAIMSVYPISLSIIKDPGSMGVDIVTGEGQSLGIPLGFGGPYLGFMATRKKLARKMPGRICGTTVDSKGRKSYVLTLQAREQHIRREKAMSNVCTNVGLMALRSVVYMALVGKQGFVEVGQECFNRAEFAKEKLNAIPGVQVKESAPTFNELTVELPVPAKNIMPDMIEKGYAAGWPLDRYYPEMKNYILMAFTEKHTQEQISGMCNALEEVLCRF
ncbi:MAG: aminomethyl-transferring glycine dehydrogenase subunit GcvPA [Lentisphaeria bacterium]|nr:aminomethyl-transferring glycine dehydrogenase subunit GcvPA [Lentisphaeria bacterium]